MANWETVEEIEGSGIHRRVFRFSVQRPTAEMVPMYSTPWPTLEVSQVAEDGEGVTIIKQEAQYAYLVDGAYVAAPDDALKVWRAEQEAAAFAVVAQEALPIAKKLDTLLKQVGLSIPATEEEVRATLMALDESPQSLIISTAISTLWDEAVDAGIDDCLEDILATEAAQ